MTLDGVKALSNKELQTKAAELDGWTKIHILSDGMIVGWPPGLEGDTEIPDYLNDIAAAMELWEMALSSCEGFPCWELRTCLDGVRGVWAFFRFASEKYLAANDREVVGEAGEGEEPLAITRAFVLAMTQEKDDEEET